MKTLAIAVLVVCAGAGVAAAHKPSDSHVRIVVDGAAVSGSIGVAVRDLDGALDLDGNGDGDVTWAEATAHTQRIADYFAARFELAGDGARCPLTLGPPVLVDFTDGAYWTVPFATTCGAPLAMTYRILFDVDVLHRGLVQVVTAAGKQTVIVRDGTPIVLELPGNARPGAVRAAREGLVFAWISLPFLLVLVGLVLPLADAGARRDVVTATARTFAAFAVGNAATMALAASGLLDLPERWIDLAIAASCIGAAVVNLCRVDEARWDLAFELGLLHGLGAALEVRYLDVEHRAGPLLGFGAGMFVGGALVVALLVPALYAVRRTQLYQAALWGGTGLVGAVGLATTYRLL